MTNNKYAHIIDKNAPKVEAVMTTTELDEIENIEFNTPELKEQLKKDREEFRLKYKCPCYEYDEHACEFNKVSECPFNNREVNNDKGKDLLIKKDNKPVDN